MTYGNLVPWGDIHGSCLDLIIPTELLIRPPETPPENLAART
jgi:hypothetical protein